MNDNLSERVKREYNEWKEKYEIPLDTEFQVKTLLKLQEEYNSIEPNSNNTKTRETLLHMIQDLQMKMILNKKRKTEMYVDYAKLDDIEKVTVFINGKILTFKQALSYSNIDYLIKPIKEMAEKEKALIYVDSCGFGRKIYDALLLYENLQVKELK
jgi:hypothetical protein